MRLRKLRESRGATCVEYSLGLAMLVATIPPIVAAADTVRSDFEFAACIAGGGSEGIRGVGGQKVCIRPGTAPAKGPN